MNLSAPGQEKGSDWAVRVKIGDLEKSRDRKKLDGKTPTQTTLHKCANRSSHGMELGGQAAKKKAHTPLFQAADSILPSVGGRLER